MAGEAAVIQRLGQERGHGGDARMVEHQHGGQREPGGHAQLIADLDGGQRVQAQFHERLVVGHTGQVGTAQRTGNRLAHQGVQRGVALGAGQLGRMSRRRLRHGRGGRLGGGGLRQLVQQRAGPGRGVADQERRPVDVGHHERTPVAVEHPFQLPDALVGGHGYEPAAPQFPLTTGVDHARAGPHTPRDSNGVLTPGGPALGERVEVGVRGGVRGLAAAAPHPGDRGEQHEPVEAGEQLVEHASTGGLSGVHGVEFLGLGLVDRGVLADSGGVENRSYRLTLGGQAVGHGPELLGVGGLSGDDLHPGAGVPQIADQVGGSGCLRAAAGQQHDRFGALRGEPAGDVRAQRSGAAGDQHGAARGPGLVGPDGGRGLQAAQPDAAGPHGDLVLPAVAGQHTGEQAGGPLVQGSRYVDQPTPPVGVFQPGDAAQPPHGCGSRVGGGLARVHAGGAGGQAPQPGTDPGVAQRLDQNLDVAGPVEQGDHPGQHGYGSDLGAQGGGGRGPVVADRHGDHVGEDAGERAQPRSRGAGVAAGLDDQPGAGDAGGARRWGQRAPGDAVPPGVGGLPVADLLVPLGEGGQGGQQVGGGAVRGGQLAGVLAVHGGPERVVVGRVPAGDRAGRGVQPVRGVLEGVRGQPDDRALAEHCGPVDRNAVGVRAGQRGQHRDDLVLVAPGGGQRDPVRPGHRGEHRVRADLDKHVGIDHRVERSGEPDRVAGVVGPVIGGAEGMRGVGGRVNGQRPRLHLQPGQVGAELGEHGLHERGVERVADPQPRHPPAPGTPVLLDALHHARGAGNHHRPGPVDGGDRGLCFAFEQDGGFILGGLDGEHGPALGQRLHEPAAGDGDQRGVVQPQHPGDHGGGQFTDRVAGYRGERDAPGLPEAGERGLVREQRRLGVLGAGQHLGRFVPHDLAQRAVQQWVDDRARLVERGLEHREPGGQLASHAGTLSPLTGEQHTDPATPGGNRLGGGERGVQLLGVPGDHGDALVEQGARGGHRPGDRREIQVVAGGGEPGAQSRGLSPGGVSGSTRQHQRHRQQARLNRDRLGAGFLDDDVGVGAADAERGNPGPARVLAPRPGQRRVQQRHRARRPVDLG